MIKEVTTTYWECDICGITREEQKGVFGWTVLECVAKKCVCPTCLVKITKLEQEEITALRKNLAETRAVLKSLVDRNIEITDRGSIGDICESARIVLESTKI